MGRTEEEKMAIAEEIVRQLGGRRFIHMTGAYDFLTLDSGVRFKLLGGFTRQGISLVGVILEPSFGSYSLAKPGWTRISDHWPKRSF